MNDMINQLYEAIYYGTDLEFMYNGNYYFVNSGKITENNIDKHSISVLKPKTSFYESENGEECVEIYSSTRESATENTSEFLETKIFDGKSFYDIADSLTEISY